MDRSWQRLDAGNVWDRPLDVGMINAFARYICFGWSPGGLGESLIMNDMEWAIQRAHVSLRYNDNEGVRNLMAVVETEFPSMTWGSQEKFFTWMKYGGLRGAPKDIKMLVKLETSSPQWFISERFLVGHLDNIWE